MIAAYEDLERSNVSQPLLRQFASRVTAEKASLEPGEPLFVNPEPAFEVPHWTSISALVHLRTKRWRSSWQPATTWESPEWPT